MNVLKRTDVGEGASDMKDIDDLGFLPKVLEIHKQERENATGNRK